MVRTTFGRLGCLVVIVVALAAAVNTNSTTAQADSQQQPINEAKKETSQTELNLKTLDKELFKRLFAKRRKEHLQAVKTLQKMDSYERQYKMIDMLAEKMFDVIDSKKVLLENLTDLELKNVSFAPQSNSNTDVADAVSNVLENVALFGDVLLSLPDVTRRVVRKQPKWNETIRWSFGFLNRTRDLLDKPTLEMIALAMRELNGSKREASHLQPNRIPSARPTNQPKSAQMARKEKRKRGPRLVNVEL
ncbi:coiled-coil domain-containing protein 134-like [Phymastichus coffea]|uniref:coiled-coil domain-containing protein 134-like n=1 Tax=Phymastichus coffea TaxID=108790 RepID=UPI00273CAA73|nr:coiled-coil domain-containing protein 134-like [Phymastichus coffea]